MAEYIERKALDKALTAAAVNDKCKNRSTWANAICVLYDLNAADVAPVVRCGDCKYHYWEQEPCHGKTVHYCELPHMRGIEIFKEFFCYYGERKEDAGNG